MFATFCQRVNLLWIPPFISKYKLFVRDWLVEGVYLFSSIPRNVATAVLARACYFIVFINSLKKFVRLSSRVIRITSIAGGLKQTTYIKVHTHYEIEILNALLVFS